MRSTRGGFTLVELLVVLVLLALLSGVAAVALVRRAPGATWRDRAVAAVARARSDALTRGMVVSIAVEGPRDSLRATAFPDGRVIADPRLAIAPMTGRPDPPDSASAHRSTGTRRAIAP